MLGDREAEPHRGVHSEDPRRRDAGGVPVSLAGGVLPLAQREAERHADEARSGEGVAPAAQPLAARYNGGHDHDDSRDRRHRARRRR